MITARAAAGTATELNSDSGVSLNRDTPVFIQEKTN
jgi:hypothetical protein